jgi:hypothetical protein
MAAPLARDGQITMPDTAEEVIALVMKEPPRRSIGGHLPAPMGVNTLVFE